MGYVEATWEDYEDKHWAILKGYNFDPNGSSELAHVQ